MKALLVTSSVTFVPKNYDELVIGLAECSEIGGLLILKNGSKKLLWQSLALCLFGAWRLGLQLFINQIGLSNLKRKRAYERQGKPVWSLASVNCKEAVEIVKNHCFDLVINARTRCIYKKEFLQAPRLGCINIHHGLLPLQRGTMCDLWALSEGSAAGFSIHQMTEKIDDGNILRCVTISDGSDRNYLNYLKSSTSRELLEVQSLLQEIKQDENKINGQKNIGHDGLKHRVTPNWRQLREILKSGLSI